MSEFARQVIEWQRVHGRHDLPWQGTRDPYRIWLSEIMLQQTQVAAVIPFYGRFLHALPDLESLARADLDQVLGLWSGLGYYSRARNLHACARTIVADLAGRFPDDASQLARLPGIGRSTAAAIAAFAFGRREAILDGNVKRVFCRHFGIEGFPGAPAVERRLWTIAQAVLPDDGLESYTQGLMDIGATICTRTRASCGRCPLSASCEALRSGRVDALPTPRERRALPVRHTRMLILVRGEQVKLEQRPPSGIWGGLWSLPELPGDAPLPALPASGWRALEPFEHRFTHFALQVQPMIADDSTGVPGNAAAAPIAADSAADPTARWLAFAAVDSAPLPRPVKTLLQSVRAARAVRSRDVAEGTGAPATGAPADPEVPSVSGARVPGSAGTRTAGSRPRPPTRSRKARPPSG